MSTCALCGNENHNGNDICSSCEQTLCEQEYERQAEEAWREEQRWLEEQEEDK